MRRRTKLMIALAYVAVATAVLGHGLHRGWPKDDGTIPPGQLRNYASPRPPHHP